MYVYVIGWMLHWFVCLFVCLFVCSHTSPFIVTQSTSLSLHAVSSINEVSQGSECSILGISVRFE